MAPGMDGPAQNRHPAEDGAKSALVRPLPVARRCRVGKGTLPRCLRGCSLLICDTDSPGRAGLGAPADGRKGSQTTSQTPCARGQHPAFCLPTEADQVLGTFPGESRVTLKGKHELSYQTGISSPQTTEGRGGTCSKGTESPQPRGQSSRGGPRPQSWTGGPTGLGAELTEQPLHSRPQCLGLRPRHTRQAGLRGGEKCLPPFCPWLGGPRIGRQVLI